MTTTFALVAIYQYRENYAIDDDGNFDVENPFWKNKGAHEAVIATEITITEATEKSQDEWEREIAEHGPKSNGFAQYDLIDWELVELNTTTITEVTDFIDEMAGEDIDYVRYCWGCDKGSEFAFNWALTQLDKEAA